MKWGYGSDLQAKQDISTLFLMYSLPMIEEMLFSNFKEVDVHEDIKRIAKENDDKSMGIT